MKTKLNKKLMGYPRVVKLVEELDSLTNEKQNVSEHPDGTVHVVTDHNTICYDYFQKIHPPFKTAMDDLNKYDKECPNCEDEGTSRDKQKFCGLCGHELVKVEKVDYNKAFNDALRKFIEPFMPCCFVDDEREGVVLTICIINPKD